MPKVTINGQSVAVDKGTTIMKAAERLGIYIPHFCYHPYLRIAGNCRMCLVEIEGAPKLTTSCSTEVQEGMVVKTDSPRVRDTVRSVLELLLINHPIDCPVCDQAGECRLQDYYMAYGFHTSRFELPDKVRKAKVVDLGRMIMLDAERCVLCSSCVRFCEEVSKTYELRFFNRGNKTEIGTFHSGPLNSGYAGNLADLCPVGALTSRDFRFKCRVWFLKHGESVCPECSTGCNIRVDHKDGKIYRFVPRENPFVNKLWMCDAGRLSYKRNNSGRLGDPMVAKDGQLVPVSWREAYLLLRSKVFEARQRYGKESFAVLVSARATNEELCLAKKLAAEVFGTPHVDFRIQGAELDPEAMEDSILKRKDKHPNSAGARALKIGAGGESTVPQILSSAMKGDIKFLFVIGGDVLSGYPDRGRLNEAIKKAACVVELASFQDEVYGGATIVFPQGTYLETKGTFTNYAGRVQRVNPVVPLPGRAKEGWRILFEILSVFGVKLRIAQSEDVFALLARENAAFNELTYATIGSQGALLSER